MGRGLRSRAFLVFSHFIAFLFIMDCVMGFMPILDVFMGLLLNKRVHETFEA